jgi:hypothetical protein
MKPSLETFSALLRAAELLTKNREIAMQRIRESIARHGFTEEQVRAYRLKK